MNYQHMKNQMIPDDEVVEKLQLKLKKRSSGTKAVRWAGAVVACLVVSLTVLNLTVPSFAESLPLVGTIFESINNRTGEKYEEPFVNETMANKAAVLQNKSEQNGEDPIDLTLEEVYCDGLNVSYSFSCIRPENWENITVGSFNPVKITVNGMDCTDNIILLPKFEYTNGRFEGSGHFNLYNTFGLEEIPDVASVELALSDMTPADSTLTFENEQSLMLRSTWTFNFNVKVNKDKTEYISVNEGHDGWILEGIANAPSAGVVRIKAPKDVTIENYYEKNDLFLNVYDAAGTPVESYGSGIFENPDGTITYVFEMRGIETKLNGVKLELLDKISGELVNLTDYEIK